MRTLIPRGMVDALCPGYDMITGSSLDRPSLVKVMQKTYQELHPGQSVAHLVHTVDQYLSKDTPLWWVTAHGDQLKSGSIFPPHSSIQRSIGCLWLGEAIDQVDGDRHAYIFLLYVDPQHRRQGIGTALMERAEQWARDRGDQKISLQVFTNNTPALDMYSHLGYRPQSFWMTKRLT